MNTVRKQEKRLWRGGSTLALTISVVLLVGFVVLNLSHTAPAAAGKTEPVPAGARTVASDLSTLFEHASQSVAPSIVPIYSEQVVEVNDAWMDPHDLLRQFFGNQFGGAYPESGQRKRTVHGLGSGVIVREDGLILTNNHVVKDAAKLTVRLNDKKEYEAKVVGTDPSTDVAVIKIDAHGLPAAQLGDSDHVAVGQWVIAVGNPYELLHTVTAGIISAKGRSAIGLATYEDFIQTDASINPGNSGGALCDLDGKVIGINTAITSPSGANAGIGFAIPINMARQVMDQLVSDGKVSRGYLALLPQDIDEELAKAMHLDSTDGALVGDVTPGGPADKAGIKRGDVIVEFNGKQIKDSADLRNVVAATNPGTRVKVEVERDGHHKTLEVKPAERPTEVAQAETKNPEEAGDNIGIRVQDLTPGVAAQLGYQHEHGVLVAGVEAGSPAEEAGLQRGDLIEQVNNHDVSSVKEFKKTLSDLDSGDPALFLTRRGTHTFFVAVNAA